MRLATERPRSRALFAVYPILALAAFPTIGILVGGTRAWMYGLDVFDDGGGLTRLAIAVREWSAHGLSLWDPYLTAGNAFLGQFALPPIAPDVALAFAVGPFAAFAVMGWATATLAGIGTHLFLRDGLGLSTPAAVGGSILAVFGFWHPIYGISIAVLPLVLWIGDRAADPRSGPRRWRYVFAGVLLGALALYAGQIQVVVFVAAIQLAWIVATSERDLATRLRTWAITWAVSFGLYGPVLVTQLILLPLSERTVWDLGYLFGGTLSDALKTIGDHYSRVLVGVPVTTGIGPSSARYGTTFLGAFGLALAVLGLLGVMRGPRTRAARFVLVLFVAIPLLDFVAILATPIQEQLGLLRSFQFVRIRHFFPFALVAAAALGMDAMVSSVGPGAAPWLRPGSRARRSATVAVGVVLVLAAGQLVVAARKGLLALRSFGVADPKDAGWVLAAAGLAVGLAGGAALLVLLWRSRPSVLGRWVLLAVGILLAGDRFLMSTAVPLLGPNIATFDGQLALTAGQEFILDQLDVGLGRVLTFGDDANRMAYHGLQQVDGYQAIYPLAYHGFFGQMTAPGLAVDADRYRYFHSWGARAYAFRAEVDPELVDLVGARWLYVDGGVVPTVPGLIERFRAGPVGVYENPAAFPRAFLVGSIEPRADDGAALAALGEASLVALHGTAIVTPAEINRLGAAAAAIPTVEPAAAGDAPEAGTATIVDASPDTIVIDIHPDRAAMVVLTDAASPGWVAEIDGQRTPIARVDGAFRGVAVDPSARRVVFRYLPGFTAVGAIGAVAATLILVGWVLRVRRRDARSRILGGTLLPPGVSPGHEPGDGDG
jgi:hypothetical protein